MTAPSDPESIALPARPVLVLVESDPAALDGFRKALEGGYAVHTASSGPEALRLIQSLSEIHVLVVRNDLPRMPGTEVLRFLREMTRNSESVVKVLFGNGNGNGNGNGSHAAAPAAAGSPGATAPDEAAPELPHAAGRVDWAAAKAPEPADLRAKVDELVAKRSREKRASMRVTLEGPSDVRIETAGGGEARVVDISENGMFLRAPSLPAEGTLLPLTVTLPGDRRRSLTARVVRHDARRGGVGVQFADGAEGARTAILQFLSEYVTPRDLAALKRRHPFLRTEDMVLFSDPAQIESLLDEAARAKSGFTVIRAQDRSSETLQIDGLRAGASIALRGEGLDLKYKTSDLLFVSFQLGYSTYTFETMVVRIEAGGGRLVGLYPRVLFYSEKRASRRIRPETRLTLEIALPPPFGGTLRGTITDISPEGVSIVADEGGPLLIPGTPLASLRVFQGDHPLWEESGEVRNASRLDGNGGDRFRYGIQFGIGRMSLRSIRPPDAAAGAVVAPASAGPDASATPADSGRFLRSESRGDLGALAHEPPQIVRLENARGEEIVALLNTSFPLDENPVPVVIIPPAFGKTKETLFALALTVVQNFRRLGERVAVLRFDGVRRKGESHKDPDASQPPFEMAHANFTQAAEDLRSILDWLDLNPRLRASRTVLVSFSLSALEVRILLRDEAYRRKVASWISVMGTPEFRELMIRVNCGLDVFEQHRLGIVLGVMPILGNLVDVDPYVKDGVANRVATLDEAREDMARLDLPVTWIYGKHDSWVRADFVRDIMSIQAAGPREVIAVPNGHNARTSEEALRLFGLIASLVHRDIAGELIAPVYPSKKQLETLRRAEKDRLPSRNLSDRAKYWRRYLIGENDLLGFDVMALSDDYGQLMRDQRQALGLGPGDRFLDLGGGTGNFVESLFESGGPLPRRIVVADLVSEAMAQAREKLSARFGPLVPGRLSFLALDAELSRFLPVRRFLSGETAGLEQLADQVENLDMEIAARLRERYSPRLHRILRGEPIGPGNERWLKGTFDAPELRVIEDLNRAARSVRGLDRGRPAFRKLSFGSGAAAERFPVRDGAFTKVLMSLVLSYIHNPVETLREVRRVTARGGRLVLSSMRPDTDASGPFTRLMDKIERTPPEALPARWPKARLLESLRSFLNDAQALFDLEEAGTFDFFDPDELAGLLDEAGWDVEGFSPSFGDPPQGYVCIARAREIHG